MELIKFKEVLKILNISQSTLYRLMEKGLPHYKIGNNYRFERAKVIEWLNAQEQVTPTEEK